MIDALAQHHYELAFKVAFREAQGDVFQQLFGRIMNMANPGDFVQTRPWGRLGDDQCDGFLRSKRRLFACYAPLELTKTVTLAKINDDFRGALPAARQFFDEWIFVHNAPSGRIPTWLVQEIQNLQTQHPGLQLDPMGFEELRQIVFSLSPSDLVSLLGPAPTHEAMQTLGLKELQPILKHLSNQSAPEDVSPAPVSPGKLNYNKLSPNVAALLTTGMAKTKLIEQYVARGRSKELGMKVGAAFRRRYIELRAELYDPDEIFHKLHSFAIGPFLPTANIQVAVYTVLAWLFEACDIFDNPPADS